MVTTTKNQICAIMRIWIFAVSLSKRGPAVLLRLRVLLGFGTFHLVNPERVVFAGDREVVPVSTLVFFLVVHWPPRELENRFGERQADAKEGDPMLASGVSWK